MSCLECNNTYQSTVWSLCEVLQHIHIFTQCTHVKQKEAGMDNTWKGECLRAYATCQCLDRLVLELAERNWCNPCCLAMRMPNESCSEWGVDKQSLISCHSAVLLAYIQYQQHRPTRTSAMSAADRTQLDSSTTRGWPVLDTEQELAIVDVLDLNKTAVKGKQIYKLYKIAVYVNV